MQRFATEPLRPEGRTAADLGCGDGRDTLTLLAHGWRVIAIDAEPGAMDGLRESCARAELAMPETRIERFEATTLPAAHLVNSSFALPLCPPRVFAEVWNGIRAALVSGGRFSGQLFGDRDDWAGCPGLTHHNRGALAGLLCGLVIEYLHEEEVDAITPRGALKHWHIFHIVARKP